MRCWCPTWMAKSRGWGRDNTKNNRMHWSVIYLISEWVIRLVMLVYVPRQRNAAASRTWLLLIFLLPWPGLLFYGLVGRIYLPKNRIDRHERASKKTRVVQER